MTVAAMIEQLERMPSTHELVICDVAGNDWPILAVTDGGEEQSVIVDVGTQDDLAASEWPIGWDHV